MTHMEEVKDLEQQFYDLEDKLYIAELNGEPWDVIMDLEEDVRSLRMQLYHAYEHENGG